MELQLQRLFWTGQLGISSSDDGRHSIAAGELYQVWHQSWSHAMVDCVDWKEWRRHNLSVGHINILWDYLIVFCNLIISLKFPDISVPILICLLIEKGLSVVRFFFGFSLSFDYKVFFSPGNYRRKSWKIRACCQSCGGYYDTNRCDSFTWNFI